MPITIEKNTGQLNVSVSGRFTFQDTSEFNNVLEMIADGNIQKCHINVSKVDFIDSAAFGLLLTAQDAADNNRCTLSVVSPSESVGRIIRISQADKIFNII